MVVRLTGDSYCSLLDELLKFYVCKVNESRPLGPPVKSVYIARKYIEHTRYGFDEIITRTKVKLKRSDFEFEQKLTHGVKNKFINSFETFIAHVMLVIRYVQGIIKRI